MIKSLKFVARFVLLLIPLAVIAGVGYLGYRAISFVFDAFGHLSPEIGTAIVVTSGTILVSVMSMILSKHFDRKAEIRREHHIKKAEVYENLVNFSFRLLFSTKPGHKPVSQNTIDDFFKKFLQDLVAWGGDSVLREFRTFRRNASSAKSEEDPHSVMFSFESLLLAIRSDLGHANAGLNKGDILRLFITDLDERLAAEES